MSSSCAARVRALANRIPIGAASLALTVIVAVGQIDRAHVVSHPELLGALRWSGAGLLGGLLQLIILAFADDRGEDPLSLGDALLAIGALVGTVGAVVGFALFLSYFSTDVATQFVGASCAIAGLVVVLCLVAARD
jgi:hypothetical protein